MTLESEIKVVKQEYDNHISFNGTDSLHAKALWKVMQFLSQGIPVSEAFDRISKIVDRIKRKSADRPQ